jgi:hypothetical protein
MIRITYDDYSEGINPAGTIVTFPLDEKRNIDRKKIELEPGKINQALKSGPLSTNYVEYEAKGVISPVGGAVEMWICPLDWTPEDSCFHVFFDARGDGALFLYKHKDYDRLLMLTRDTNATEERNRHSNIYIGNWKPGEWHHIAGTWSALGVMCYVDGEPAGDLIEGWLPKRLDTLKIGDQPWGSKERKSSSLIDDVRIYDRPLSPAQIKAHSEGNYDFKIPPTKDGTCLKYNFNPEMGEVKILVSIGGADVEDAQISARLDIVPKGGPISPNARTFSFICGSTVQSLASPQPGEYDVVAEIISEICRPFELRGALRIPTKEWQGSQLGIDDKVLPPWTPLNLEGGRGRYVIKCWGREYAFMRSALPAQITSKGETLLSQPMSLHITKGLERMSLISQTVQVIFNSDTRAELAGVMTGRLGNQAIRIKTFITIEYDGLLLIKLSCEAPREMALDSIIIDIPLRPNRAIYLHRFLSNGGPGFSGRVPEGDGVVDKSMFIPYAWLGDNDRGLFWFCESDEHWPNSESESAIEIMRSPIDVRLKLNLLARDPEKDLALPSDWQFTFGLQATPVKPLPKNWRKWRLEGWQLENGRKAKEPNVSIIWPAWLENQATSPYYNLKHFGYPEAMNSTAFLKFSCKKHLEGIKVLPYLCLAALSDACPEWPFFKDCAMGPDFGYSPDVHAYPPLDKSTCRGYHESFKVVSPLCKDYCDFIVWKNKQFIRSYGIDGSYHDLTQPWGSRNLNSGCGYIRDRTARMTYPILAYRELYRRMYNVIKSLQKETLTVAHMSGNVVIPILAYDDCYLDGEQFSGPIKGHLICSYVDVMSKQQDEDRIQTALEYFRTEFMGRQWGLIPFFLPEFDTVQSETKELTRNMMAILMIHDISPWAICCNATAVDEACSELEEFDYFESEFIPYFDSEPPATFELEQNFLNIVEFTGNPHVYISAYQQADKRTLLIVANLDNDSRMGKLCINLKRLDLRRPGSRLMAMSLPDKELLAIDPNGILNININKLDYLMIVIAPCG